MIRLLNEKIKATIGVGYGAESKQLICFHALLLLVNLVVVFDICLHPIGNFHAVFVDPLNGRLTFIEFVELLKVLVHFSDHLRWVHALWLCRG